METALFRCNFFSYTLGLSTSLTVILPQLSVEALASNARRIRPLPTLYLLHGLSDDDTIWQRRTSIERYVAEMNLAVVMPAVHRSFYTDMAHGGKYWQFISQELPAQARSFFPLSESRADNFVAGLSMGGYGAFKLALSQPQRFAAAASLSGALDIAELASQPDPQWQKEVQTIFGDAHNIAGSDKDLFRLAEQVAAETTRPRLYQCCGTEDFLYTQNVRFRDHAQKLGLDLTYDEGPGEHVWSYWDSQIQKVLAWLPLERAAA